MLYFTREGGCSTNSFVFNAMSKEMVDSVAISGCFKSFPVNTVLFSEGQTVDKFYIIKRGVCKVFRKINSRREKTSHNELLWKNQYCSVLNTQRELAKPGTASLKKMRDEQDNSTFQNVQVSTLGPGDILGELAVLLTERMCLPQSQLSQTLGCCV